MLNRLKEANKMKILRFAIPTTAELWGFTLKDKEDGSLLKCVLGGWQYKKIGVPLENGMEVKVTGVSKISKKWGRMVSSLPEFGSPNGLFLALPGIPGPV